MSFGTYVAHSMAKSMTKHDAVRKAKEVLPQAVDVEEFSYVQDGHEMHKLNVYRPKNAKGVLPLIVDVHGGAWIYGDKELNKNYCMHLARRGYCVAGMSYRLLPEVTLKEQVEDVFAALGYIADRAAEWGADTSAVMLTGDSAGGHLSSLALCVCLDPALAQLYEVTPPALEFSCLVMSHPVCEVHSILRNKKDEPLRGMRAFQNMCDKLMFGADPKSNKLFDHAAFSQYSAAVRLPYVMIIGCERDVYVRHSRFLSRLLGQMQAEGRCEKFVFDWTDKKTEQNKLCHVYDIAYPDLPDGRRACAAATAFFEESRKAAGKARE